VLEDHRRAQCKGSLAMRCRIAIPTFNRASLIGRAVRCALEQSYTDLEVMVIDDGSTDDTEAVLAHFMSDPRFCYVRLAENRGTAVAKNVAIALGHYDAISFHDSDDIAERDKLLRQANILNLKHITADPILNWSIAGIAPAANLPVDVVFSQHWLLDRDGARRHIRRALSLVDDFFPQLQMNAGPLGDWILINPALFRRSALIKAGGFERCVEEDRELRNRLLMHGAVFWLIEDPLLTKIEYGDSLTVSLDTNYLSDRRRLDRNLVWERASAWRNGGKPCVSHIHLGDTRIATISNPQYRSIASDISLASNPEMPT
jgi:glycosyltransferase involved in cell wall biosynthesis